MATANVQIAIVDDTRPGLRLIEVVQAAGCGQRVSSRRYRSAAPGRCGDGRGDGGDDGLGVRVQTADGKTDVRQAGVRLTGPFAELGLVGGVGLEQAAKPGSRAARLVISGRGSASLVTGAGAVPCCSCQGKGRAQHSSRSSRGPRAGHQGLRRSSDGRAPTSI